MFLDDIFKEYDISGLDHEGLDAAWVDAVKDYLKEKEDGKLTEEDCEAREAELLTEFKKNHEELIEDSDETKGLKDDLKKSDEEKEALRQKNLALEAKDEAVKCSDMDSLLALKEKYKDVPAAIANIDEQVPVLKAKLERQAQKTKDQQRRQRIETGHLAIDQADSLEKLAELEKEYGQEAELKELFAEKKKTLTEKKGQDDKNEAVQKVIAELKALHGKHVDYPWLRERGIEPTGGHMRFHGIVLFKRFMMKVYEVRVPKELRGD